MKVSVRSNRADCNFGHVTHGYVTTSIAAQGRTADHVLIAQSAESYPASNEKQLYVSVSRARKNARIYCEDKDSLRRAIQKSAAELTGHHLFKQQTKKRVSRILVAAIATIRRHREQAVASMQRQLKYQVRDIAR